MTYLDTKTICLQNLVNCGQSLEIFENIRGLPSRCSLPISVKAENCYRKHALQYVVSVGYWDILHLVSSEVRDKTQAKLKVFNVMRTFLFFLPGRSYLFGLLHFI